ncbi:ABC-2 family transporter protein [Urbifossiella limnaea]|uniref:ABC-2 family transporter protein n=2 Tax=Urbifossiella limnaea TaxID=2528023 RepID=A0A517Y224_9BACT|nr:ABC-2 family transporter protein [Urbifossiella limnaea]
MPIDAAQSSIVDHQSSIPPRPSPLVGFFVLVAHSFRRHWRVRQMGWVSIGLLSLTVAWVAAVTLSAAGWRLEDRRSRRFGGLSHREYAEQLRPAARYKALDADLRDAVPSRHSSRPPESAPVRLPHPGETPTPLDPTADALRSLVLSVPAAVLASEKFTHDWAFTNFTRSVPLGAFVGFVLPLFTLAFASGALGTERESRSLVWLLTRPQPRPAIYVATFLGALPWCLLFGVGGFAALCLAGGDLGREAFTRFWPAAVGGTAAFAALFHLVGATFRRPVVVGLVYVFFFEALVALLPGSLKLLSLSFYARSLIYNDAVDAGYPAAALEVPEAVSAGTAWAVLATATLALLALGAWRFGRAEYRDDV